jgi:hypothetical protein
MSLVNSLINQIGREMGRDIYWTARQSLTQSVRNNNTHKSNGNVKGQSLDHLDVEVDVNEVMQGKISKLNLNAISNSSIRKHEIEMVLEEMDLRVNPRSFNWREVYVSMDNKLDELKFMVDEKELADIEQFDKRNFVMFSVANNQHISWIQTQIAELKKSPYYGLKSLSSINLIGWSIVGLASIPLKRGGLNRGAEFFAAILWISAAVVFFKASEIGISEPIIRYGIAGFALFLFLLILSGNFIVRNERDSKVNYISSRVLMLEQYLEQIRKSAL